MLMIHISEVFSKSVKGVDGLFGIHVVPKSFTARELFRSNKIDWDRHRSELGLCSVY